MKIREKLTIQFSTLVMLILITFSASIYIISRYNRFQAFRIRLTEKAINNARMLLEVKQINAHLLKDLRRNYFQSLPEEFFRVYDKNNQPFFKDDTVSYELSDELLNEARRKGELSYKVGTRQLQAIIYKKDYIVVTSARNIYGDAELKDLAFILVVGNVICLFIILLVGWFFSRQALKPISGMISSVENMGEENLGLRLDEGQKKDEISQLAITFNKLFDKIEDAFERQKRFVSNASHELRTPLTAITGEIEVALMKDREKTEYVQVLLSALEETKTLTKLSNDLLKLTQTGNMKGLLVKRISVAELIQAIDDENTKRNHAGILNFEMPVPLEAEKLFVRGNLDLLKISVINVIENGYKFSYNHPVSFIVRADDDFLYLEIRDEGIGMREDEVDFIFQPFYRSTNVITFEGSGIGLSLTQRIIKIHGGTIAVHSEPGKGTSVTLGLLLEK
ncbi:MAG TPA: ATP-binding protein [Cytophagaceae bacterium]|jgi:signal transduction histidine kinase|nr:ATP-binding protein [Cytophagaceae bacterium]